MIDAIRKKLGTGGIYRIVFVGDSLTSTEWVHPNWREIVEYVLKAELEKQISDWKIPSWQVRTFNSGLDGATTRDIREKLPEYVFNIKPDFMMLMIGGNDKYLLGRDETKENLHAIIESCQEQGIKIALSTDPRLFNAKYDEKDRDLRKIVRSFQDRVDIFTDLHELMREEPLEKFFTFISENGNEDAGIKPGEIDYCHPNMYGNAVMAQYFLKSIFGISFDPHIYLNDVDAGVMYPNY